MPNNSTGVKVLNFCCYPPRKARGKVNNRYNVFLFYDRYSEKTQIEQLIT